VNRPARTEQPARIVGLDVGATRSRVAVISNGNSPVERHGPGFNLSVDDARRVATILADLITSTMAAADRDVPPVRGAVCCIGIAGAGRNRPAEQLRLSVAAALGIPGSDVLIETDARIALAGAFEGRPGALILAGTGSGCHAAGDDGAYYKTGGWGPTIGDPGSGRSIGTAMIRLALEMIETAEPDRETRGSEFAAALARRLHVSADVESLLGAVYSEGFAAASIAPFAFEWCERWHRVESAVREECTPLCVQFGRLRARTGLSIDSVAVRGGLTEETVYMRLLREALEDTSPDVRIVSSAGRPIDGALQLAKDHSMRRAG